MIAFGIALILISFLFLFLVDDIFNPGIFVVFIILLLVGVVFFMGGVMDSAVTYDVACGENLYQGVRISIHHDYLKVSAENGHLLAYESGPCSWTELE